MKNIIVLLCDCLRFDCITPSLTPNLIKISRNGFLLKRLARETSTLQSMPYLLCNEKKFDFKRSLQSCLRKRGYYTVLISTNILVSKHFSKGWNEQHYYPEFKPIGGLKRILGKLFDKYIPSKLRNRFFAFRYRKRELPYMPAKKLLQVSMQKIDELPEPFFVWIHLMDPHLPYFPNSERFSVKEMTELYNKLLENIFRNKPLTEIEKRKLFTLYRENIREMDEEIGLFYQSLNEKSVFVVTADHGEEFGEYGEFGHRPSKFVSCLQEVPLIINRNSESYKHLELYSLIKKISEGKI